MSVPLDRLYNFIHDLCNHDIIIYRFYPHGSKKITDCRPLLTMNLAKVQEYTSMRMVCHDQEPLNLSFYNYGLTRVMHRLVQKKILLYDKVLLLHSEKNSNVLEHFEHDDAIGVYWWSHAIIARDWFRYATVDLMLNNFHKIKYDFLVYNRAWGGSREYRLRFSELIVDSDLSSNCYMNFSPTDLDQDYRAHKFSNPNLTIKRNDLEQYFRPSTASSCYSADYDSADYNQCAVEIVLETLFDDSRWHLTEKSLRPIACGKPFILASTPGSLEYLKSYGFKTFSPWIDESYDTVQDPNLRLQAIANSMQKFSLQTLEEKQNALAEMQTICAYNKNRFFSTEFMQQVLDEFCNNLEQGVLKLQNYKGKNFTRLMKSYGSTEKCKAQFSRQDLVEIWTWLRNN